MAIQKPYGISVRGSCIDAAFANTISWSISGGISYAFSISILKNSDGTVAFTLPKTTSFATSYSLPAASLQNGNEYKISITVFDVDNNSATSDYEIFSTSSTPIITVDPIGTVGSSSYQFGATYSQSQNVSLKSWSTFLFDNNNTLLAQSGLQTTTTLSYLFEGLQSDKAYKIEFQATSSKGLVGSSGKVSFNVQFDTPILSVSIEAENTTDAGVKLSWTATQIIGHSDSTTYENNTILDVTDGKSVVFDEGFEIINDFTLKTWISSVTNYTISNNPEIIISNTAPDNINALWLYDPNQATPKSVGVTVKNTAPSNQYDLWLEDGSQTTDRLLGMYLGVNAPTNVNNLWLNIEDQKTQTEVLTLDGINGRISLEYYNSAFYLIKYDSDNNRTVVTSASAASDSYYIYIQQIGESLLLGVQELGQGSAFTFITPMQPTGG